MEGAGRNNAVCIVSSDCMEEGDGRRWCHWELQVTLKLQGVLCPLFEGVQTANAFLLVVGLKHLLFSVSGCETSFEVFTFFHFLSACLAH